MYEIDRNMHGYIILKKTGSRLLYFSGIRQGKPQFVLDHLYARAYKREETARKTVASF